VVVLGIAVLGTQIPLKDIIDDLDLCNIVNMHMNCMLELKKQYNRYDNE